MTTLFVKAGIEQSAILDRARAVPTEEREKILRYCVEVSRQLGPDEYHREFGSRPNDKHAVPDGFAAVQPRRVLIAKNHATIQLHVFGDIGTAIRVDGLDTSSLTAMLLWGEMNEGKEAWADLQAVQ